MSNDWFCTARATCEKLIPIGDLVFACSDLLRHKGFLAHDLHESFITSFAETSDEEQLHRKCVQEEAKELLGQPSPVHFPSLDDIYESPFLANMRRHRDKENGVPMDQLGENYPATEVLWRRQFDPCQRRLTRLICSDRSAYDSLYTTLGHEIQAQRRTELSERCVLYRLALEPNAFEESMSAVGFSQCKIRAKTGLLYQRPISGTWNCSIVIDERPLRNMSILRPRMELRLNGASQRLEAKVGEFLDIDYLAYTPGLFGAYAEFNSDRELAFCMEAHSIAIDFLATRIEEKLNTDR